MLDHLFHTPSEPCVSSRLSRVGNMLGGEGILPADWIFRLPNQPCPRPPKMRQGIFFHCYFREYDDKI